MLLVVQTTIETQKREKVENKQKKSVRESEKCDI